MAMSRRKQLHPKSLKEGDEIVFVLPNELKFDDESNDIIAQVDLKQNHRFGPFPASVVPDSIVQIADQVECFQLLDIKYNWLARCSLIVSNSPANLNIIYKNNQIFGVLTESVSSGTRLYSNKIILPKLNMNNEIKIKEEPIESPAKKQYPLVFICDTCGIRFSHQDTLDAHRQHYCTKREITKSHSTDSTITVKVKSMKRKSTDITDSSSIPTKRLSLLSNDTYCSQCDILFSKADNLIQHKLYYCPTTSSSACKLKKPTVPFDRPIQIGSFIYVPIPVIPTEDETTSNHDNKPLDLTKPKIINNKDEKVIVSSNSPLDLSIEKEKIIVQHQIHQCDYCSIRFSSLKTLHAHQDSYCVEYRKQKKNDKDKDTKETKSTLIDHNRSQSPLTDSSNPSHRSSLFICRLCQYQGNTLRGMRMHLKLHLSDNKSNSNDDEDDDIIIKPSPNYPLPILPSTNDSLLKCKICSAMFDYEETLLNHIKGVHTNEILIECLECQSRFCSKWNLIRHMKLTHTNLKYDEEEEEEIKLDENNKSSNPTNLTRHILLPNKIIQKKKFPCPYCHIKFVNMDTLKQHIINYCSSNMKKTEINKKTFCSSCQILFQHKTSYDAHKMYYCTNDSRKTLIKIQT